MEYRKGKEIIEFEIDSGKAIQLRKQGLTYEQIQYELGLAHIGFARFYGECSRIFKTYMKKHPGELEVDTSGRKKLPEDRIVELRREGVSLRKIAETIRQETGESVSIQTISNRIKKLPEAQKAARYLVPDNEIFDLRQQGFPYTTISKMLNEKGYIITWYCVEKQCKRIYEERGIEEPASILSKAHIKGVRKIKQTYTSKLKEEIIIKLRKKGYSANEIAEILGCTRISIIKRIEQLRKKGIDSPKAQTTKLSEYQRKVIEGVRRGLNYSQIAGEYGVNYNSIVKSKANLIKKGIINSRGEILVDLSAREIDQDLLGKISEFRLRKQLEQLMKSKNATPKQIAEIARYYGIDPEIVGKVEKNVLEKDENER